LYIHGSEEVTMRTLLAAREEILRRLDAAGYIDRRYPLLDAIPSAEVKDGFVPELATENEPLEKVIFHGPMISFYERFLAGPVRHFDFVWLRAKRPGITDATPPHYDVVFMGRGTKRLYTSWTPLEDRVNGGKFADDALVVREQLGGRWLTADFRAGDVLLFGMYLMPTSLSPSRWTSAE
jgi:hypothetical protein